MAPKWIDKILMSLSPHDENKLYENTEGVKERIQRREETREHAVRQNRDYIDMQLNIMKRRL